MSQDTQIKDNPVLAWRDNFLGSAPGWYKIVIILFLAFNPVLLAFAGPFITGWLLVLEFIFTLGAALKCYPLQPGGLLALEAVIIGLTGQQKIYEEVVHNLPVILLLMFMVAGIFFMKELLLVAFTRLLIGIRRKWLLSLLFLLVSAVLSAFLDALTVTAVIITVAMGFYTVYTEVESGDEASPKAGEDDQDSSLSRRHDADLEEFRRFLCSLMMHGVVGTALGGVSTLVGEPQNLLIAHQAGWHFMEFFIRVAPVSLPVFAVGLVVCVALERSGRFGYGAGLPDSVRSVLEEHEKMLAAKRNATIRAGLWAQLLAALLLFVALAFHVAEVGLIGLGLIVVLTALTGIVQEHRMGHAFEEAMPFTALLVVFFVIVAVIDSQQLFSPVIHWVLTFEGKTELGLLYAVNGLLSMVSDNVFVATVYIKEVKAALLSQHITATQFQQFAVAINAGTNIPSIATPNGQAAFLFLLTSGLAPLIRLSYGRMVWMALPYTLVLAVTGLLTVVYLLPGA